MSAAAGGIFRRIGHYSLAKLAIMAAGFVSFPILTRLLSPADYGVMGLLLLLINLLVSISKLGLQFSTIRLWPQWDETDEGRSRFMFTLFVTSSFASLVVVVLYDLGTTFLRPLIGQQLSYYILLSSPLVVIRALNSFGLAVLQARQWSKAHAIFEVLLSYAAMILAVLGVAVIIGGLTGYYVGLMIGEAAVVIVLVLYTLRETRFRAVNLSVPLLREAVAFGLPLAIFEMSGVLFYTGDRVIISWLQDNAQLGYYTVAFNLVQYIYVIFTLPVMMTVQPAAATLYEKEGQAAAASFLRTSGRYFLMFAMAAVVGLALVREDLLVLLASNKFLPGAGLLDILLAGFLLVGAREILGAGLFLKKRPWKMASLNLVGAALNIGLNLGLIPIYGIWGAALATLISQLTMTIVAWKLGSRLVQVGLDLKGLLIHALCTAGMGGVVYFIDPGPGVLRLVLRIVGGGVVFGLLVASFDPQARALMQRMVARLRRR